jgi:hypothetical protein
MSERVVGRTTYMSSITPMFMFALPNMKINISHEICDQADSRVCNVAILSDRDGEAVIIHDGQVQGKDRARQAKEIHQ